MRISIHACILVNIYAYIYIRMHVSVAIDIWGGYYE